MTIKPAGSRKNNHRHTLPICGRTIIRLSIGLEDASNLIYELERGFALLR